MQDWMRQYRDAHSSAEAAFVSEHFDALERRIGSLEAQLHLALNTSISRRVWRRLRGLAGRAKRWAICRAAGLSGNRRGESAARFPLERAYFQRLQARLPAAPPPVRSQRRLFVDVSQTVYCQFMAGTPRVVTEISAAALQEGGAAVFVREERLWTFSRPDMVLEEVVPQAGDLFLIADPGWNVQRSLQKIMRGFKAAGGSSILLLYDMLPVLHPEFFPASFERIFRSWIDDVALGCDAVVTISRVVAQDLAVHALGEGRDLNCALKLGWFHLGADFLVEGLAPNAEVERQLGGSDAPLFIGVSTLEPRKGYAVALDAMELLWRDGVDVRYAIVGRYGWGCRALAQRIRSHPEFGRRLLWFDAAQDDTLDHVYRRAHALVYPSVAEGFGLPIVESARYRIPVIASDIPVFREIAGDGIRYFAPGDAFSLAREMRQVMADPRPAEIRPLSWAESAASLVRMLDEDAYQYQGLPAIKALAGWPSEPDFADARPGEPPAVSIVTVTRDSLFYTRLQVERIRATLGARPHEIIVVDRGSRDGTLEWLRGQPDVRLIDYPQTRTDGHGHGEAAEFGVRAARFGRIVLLDSDAFPVDADWLAQTVDRLDSEHRLAGAAFVAERAHHAHGYYAHPHFMAFFKEDLGGLIVLRKLRGQDEDTGEESTIRVLAAGKKIVAMPMSFFAPLGVGRQDIPTISAGVVHAWYSSRLVSQEEEVRRESEGAISMAGYGAPLQEKIRAYFGLSY